MPKFEPLAEGYGEIAGYHPFMSLVSGTVGNRDFKDLADLVDATLPRWITEDLARMETMFWKKELHEVTSG